MRTINVYSFDELSDGAKEKAIEAVRNSDWYMSDFNPLEYDDYYTELLIENGFDNPEIHFRGFWSQGDGACFDAGINVDFWLEKTKEQIKADRYKYLHDKQLITHWNTFTELFKEHCMLTIYKNSFGYHYCHEKTRGIDCYVDSFPCGYDKTFSVLKELCNHMTEVIESKRLELSIKIYKMLEAEYDYEISDECISEFLRANDYEFTVDGKIYK